jgi:hypothetical protein
VKNHTGNGAHNGASFGPPTNISNANGDSIGPELVISKGEVSIAWEEYPRLDNGIIGKGDICFSRSTNASTAFVPGYNLSKTPGDSGWEVNESGTKSKLGIAKTVMIAPANNIEFIAWSDRTPGNLEILLVRSDDHGSSFNDSINISNSLGHTALSDIEVSNGMGYIAWSDSTVANF